MKPSAGPSADQLQIHGRCFHPTGRFIEFAKSEIEQSIAERFDKIVRLHPDRPAVIADSEIFTYRELDAHASLIARHLIDRLGTESEPVAILLESGYEVVAAILSVLKAGKFFSLLDPNFPVARCAAMIEDAQTRVIIANRVTRSLAEQVAPPPVQIVDLDDLPALATPTASQPVAGADALGFLLYTSGTTGKPKGVVQTQRNMLHGVMRRVNGFHICPADRLTLLSNATHQAVMNILSAVLSGAAICPFDARSASAREFAAWLTRTEITIYHSSASLLRQLIGALSGREDLSRIRLVRAASEAPSLADVEQYQLHFPDTCLFSNGLGSTETGTSTLYFVDKHTRLGAPTVPIGFPLEDIEILLLNDDGEEDRAGVGEIAIRSRYLAPGYWRQPELTASRFRRDPGAEATRVYLTGDLGRFTESGALEHLGRKDFQIKIRGHRIETSEVEQKLNEHGAIAQAVVTGQPHPSGETRLVAYLVPRSADRLTVTALREFLRDKLPEPMIPSIFVYLDALPLNPGGKVDRGVLPVPGSRRPHLDTPFAPPNSEVEQELARVWAEVLGLDEVGVHDRFFDLGGQSLLATQIISRVIEKYKIDIPIRALFEAPTVAQMAVIIDAKRDKSLEAGQLERLLAELESMSEATAAERLAGALPDNNSHG